MSSPYICIRIPEIGVIIIQIWKLEYTHNTATGI